MVAQANVRKAELRPVFSRETCVAGGQKAGGHLIRWPHQEENGDQNEVPSGHQECQPWKAIRVGAGTDAIHVPSSRPA